MTQPAALGLSLILSAPEPRAKSLGTVAAHWVVWKAIMHGDTAGGCD